MTSEISRNVPQMAKLLSIDTVHEYINKEKQKVSVRIWCTLHERKQD